MKTFNWSKFTIIFIIFLCAINSTLGSLGDRTQFYQNCRENCERTNCSRDGIHIKEKSIDYYEQTVFDKILQWTCSDECDQSCMWRTVAAFLERGWPVPQFYGKWPFRRFMGLQEPASVIFSIINLIIHIRSLRKFRREVRADAPCYKLWHFFSFVCVNGWIWSTIFHARDYPLTELLDYAFAYSIVLANFFCLVYRMIFNMSLIFRGLITLLFISFYGNYFAYLSIGKFSYALNMTANIITGCLSGSGWLIWYFYVRKRRPYTNKLLRFYVLFAMAMSLELLDFPPILWTFDAHSLWHLATAPLVPIFYSFMIDDCRALRKEKLLQAEKFNKEI